MDNIPADQDHVSSQVKTTRNFLRSSNQRHLDSSTAPSMCILA